MTMMGTMRWPLSLITFAMGYFFPGMGLMPILTASMWMKAYSAT